MRVWMAYWGQAVGEANPQPIFLNVAASEKHSQTSEFSKNSEVFFVAP
jgi:hypothetical protein